MSLYKQYKTDETKTTEGVAIKLFEAENENGTIPTFYLARMASTNKAYQKAMEAKTRPYRRQIELNTMSEETAIKINIDVFCDTILKGWENVSDEAGNALPFNKQNAVKLMTDLPDVLDRLTVEAKNIENFRASSLEDEAKN